MSWWVGDIPLADAARAQLSPRAIDELQEWLWRRYLATARRAEHDKRCVDCGQPRRTATRCLTCHTHRRDQIRKELGQLGGDLKIPA